MASSLTCTDDPIQILLTNSGVPVSFVDSDAGEIFPTDFTAQYFPHLVEPLNGAGIANAGGELDEPLFRLTITRFIKLNSTSIGASRSHVLCAFSLDLLSPLVALTGTVSVDLSGNLLFLRLLSQLYQGLEPPDPPPCYESEAIEFTESPCAPHPPFSCRAPPWEQPERRAMEPIALRLTATQLTEMHNVVAKGMEPLRMSRLDPVVGLLVRCLSEVKPEEAKPIDTISYVVNVRVSTCPPQLDLFCHSTAEWAYTRATQRSTPSFGFLQEYNSPKAPILTKAFWPAPLGYASRWGG